MGRRRPPNGEEKTKSLRKPVKFKAEGRIILQKRVVIRREAGEVRLYQTKE